ncbi:MAG: hypothetical protein ACREQJ_11645 [Candidatus Binatia bacterium]
METRAGELAAIINAAPGEGRETLRELALTIVREEVLTKEQDVSAPTSVSAAAKQSSNPLAMAIPFFMMGCVTIFLFPPVGLLLFGFTGLLVIIGIGTSIFTRTSRS